MCAWRIYDCDNQFDSSDVPFPQVLLWEYWPEIGVTRDTDVRRTNYAGVDEDELHHTRGRGVIQEGLQGISVDM